MRNIPTKKATKLLKDYKNNNYNAKKTLIDNGYAESTAIKQGKRTIEKANETIINKLELDTDTPIEDVTNVLDIVGLSRDEVLEELLKVIKQDRDFTNKLKAMKPMLDFLNYNLEDDNTTKAPSVNIKVEKLESKSNDRVIEAETES